jgi:hypothetical protein
MLSEVAANPTVLYQALEIAPRATLLLRIFFKDIVSQRW